MCGIAGIKKMGNDPITKDEIIFLLTDLETRGNDATGIALMTAGQLKVYKADVAAFSFVRQKGFDEFIDENLDEEDTTCFIGHTRFATIGNPRENKNNHPLTSETTAIVHNGGVHNHEDVFKKSKFERLAETDSDAIRAYVDEYGLTKETIHKMNKDFQGTIAAACLSTVYPDKVLLLRSGSPLVVAKVGDKLMWASLKSSIHKASRVYGEWKGMYTSDNHSGMKLVITPKDTGWVIGPDGLEEHAEFKTCNYYTAPDYSRVRTQYQVRQAKFNNLLKDKQEKERNGKAIIRSEFKSGKQIDYYVCRNPNCKTTMSLNDEQRGASLWRLQCPDCQWLVEEPPQALVN